MLCIINIISALHKENKLQLRSKNLKLFRLIPRNLKLFRLIPRRIDTQYQVSVLNVPTENVKAAPLQY